MNITNKIKEIYKGEIYGANETLIQTYWSWYRGFVDNFHNYRMYNGENYISLTKKSLQMAKKVCETWADLLINEKCDIILNPKTKKNLDAFFKKTKFWTKANQLVEKSFALGYGALVGEITPKKEIKITLLDARYIVPLHVENDEVIDCAFYNKKGEITNLTIWMKNQSGIYEVHSRSYLKDKELLDRRVDWVTGLEIPFFMFIKPNIVSNASVGEENYGMSIFSNSIDTLKALDTKYDNFDFEFIGGRKKLYVSVDAMKVVRANDGRGTSINQQPFDPLDSVYYNLGEPDDGKPMVKEEGGELRSAQFIEAINTELSLLSHKVGLGYGYFQFESKGIATATQVISEKSDLYSTLKKHEILIGDQLTEFTIAILEYHKKLNIPLGEFDVAEIEVVFDDSIIEDTTALKQSDTNELINGTMTAVEYAVKWKGLDEDTAKARYQWIDWSKKANALLPLLDAKLITPELAVEVIYHQDDNPIVVDLNKIKEYLESDDLNIDDGEFGDLVIEESDDDFDNDDEFDNDDDL